MFIAIGVGLSLTSCSVFYEEYGVKPDNFVEELVEDAVQHITGIKADLSGDSEENEEGL